MLTVVVIILTFLFSYLFFKRAGRLPTLQYVIIVALAILATMQNLKFFYFMFAPGLEEFPFIGSSLSRGVGIIKLPSELKTCLESVGSEFDRFNLALGPVAVIWLSIKQILEILPKKTVSKQSTTKQSTP